jgi:hypothetical protein
MSINLTNAVDNSREGLLRSCQVLSASAKSRLCWPATPYRSGVPRGDDLVA